MNKKFTFIFGCILVLAAVAAGAGTVSAHHTYCEDDSNSCDDYSASGDDNHLKGNIDRDKGFIHWKHWLSNIRFQGQKLSTLNSTVQSLFVQDHDAKGYINTKNLYNNTPYWFLFWDDSYNLNEKQVSNTYGNLKVAEPNKDKKWSIIRINRLGVRDATVPNGSKVIITVHNGKRTDDRTLAKFVIDGNETNRRLKQHSKKIQLNNYYRKYRVSVELRRDNTSIDSPQVSGIYAYYSTPGHRRKDALFVNHGTLVTRLNSDMFEAYDSRAGDSDYTLTPRLPAKEYKDREVDRCSSCIFRPQNNEGEKATPIRDVFTNISYIGKSTIQVDDPKSKAVSIAKEGFVIVTVGGAKEDVPKGIRDNCGIDNADEGNDPCDNGENRWQYTYNDIKYDVSLKYKRSSGKERIISQQKISDGGTIKIPYRLTDEEADGSGTFKVKTNAMIEFKKSSQYKEQYESTCPDGNLSKSGYQVPDELPSNAVFGASCDDGYDADGDNDNFGNEEYRVADEWNQGETSYVRYTKVVQDERIVRFPERKKADTPSQDGYNVEVVRFNDKSWVRVERKNEGPDARRTNFKDTRWLEISAYGNGQSVTSELEPDKTITKNITLNQPIKNKRSPRMELFLRGKLKNEQVTASIKKQGAEGGFTRVYYAESTPKDDAQTGNWHEISSKKNKLCTSVCTLSTSSIDGILPDGTKKVTVKLRLSENVDDLVIKPRAWLYIYPNTERRQGRAISRWRHAFVRDTRWDTLLKLKTDCGEDNQKCHDYASQGAWINDGQDDLGGKLGDIHPSPTLPLHAVQVPTGYRLLTPGKDIEGAKTVDALQNNITISNIRKRGSERRGTADDGYAGINPEAINKYCALAINTNSQNRRCHLSQSFLAGRGYTDSVYEQEYNPIVGFTLKSEKQIHNLQISRDVSWKESNLYYDTVRRGAKASINVQNVPPRQVNSEFTKESGLELGPNNQYKRATEMKDSEVQLRIKLTDENGDPISLQQREQNNGESAEGKYRYPKDSEEYILVENALYRPEDQDKPISEADPSDFKPLKVDTNRNGVAYVTVYETKESKNTIVTSSKLVTVDQWWEISPKLRVINDTEQTTRTLSKSRELPTGSMKNVLVALILLFGTAFIAESRVAAIVGSDKKASDYTQTIGELLPPWFWPLFMGGAVAIFTKGQGTSINDVLWLILIATVLTAAFRNAKIFLATLLFGFLSIGGIPAGVQLFLLLMIGLITFFTK